MEQRTSVKYSCDTRRIDRTFRGEINSSRTSQVAVRLPSVPSGSWLINQDNKQIDQGNITRHWWEVKPRNISEKTATVFNYFPYHLAFSKIFSYFWDLQRFTTADCFIWKNSNNICCRPCSALTSLIVIIFSRLIFHRVYCPSKNKLQRVYVLMRLISFSLEFIRFL